MTPARWGFAATASTTDLRAITPLTPQNETLWSHDPVRWLLNMTLLYRPRRRAGRLDTLAHPGWAPRHPPATAAPDNDGCG